MRYILPKTIIALALTTSIAFSQVLVESFDFNTPGDTEGWIGSGQVIGLTVADAVQGAERVLTSTNISGNDPQLLYNSTIDLPVGATWSSIEIRFRQLDGDPPGGSPTTYSDTGTRLEFNDTFRTRMEPVTTATYSGNGGIYASDSYPMTVVSGANDWQTMTVDFTNAPGLNSANITMIQFDPLGSNANGNFEVDYVNIYASIPETSTYALGIGLAGLLFALFRRRYK